MAATSTSTTHIELDNQTDIYMLYMSCLQVDMDRAMARFAGAAFDTELLAPLLAALDPNHLRTAHSRVVDSIELHARLKALAPDRALAMDRALRDALAAEVTGATLPIKIERELWQRVMLASTIYALGRMTYIVSRQARLVAASHLRGEIDAQTAEQILLWIDERRSAAKLGSGGLGMDFDEAEWIALAQQLRTSA
jgi:hypothetical protein